MKSPIEPTQGEQLVPSSGRDGLSNHQPINPFKISRSEAESQFNLDSLEDKEEKGLNSPRALKSLKNFNQQLGNLAEKLMAKGELNGLSLLGAGTQLTSLGISLATREPIDQQEAGNSIIKRFEQIVPEQMTGDSLDYFVWNDPNSGKKYRFEISGGEQEKVGGKMGKKPKVLRGVEVNQAEEKEVFFATKLNPNDRFQVWQIERCDFNRGQLESLHKARRQMESDRSPESPTVRFAHSFCL
jgi:hypothetical protein